MIARGVVLTLALQFAAVAMSAETPINNNSPSQAKEARQSTPAVAPADSIADLFPGPGGSADSPQQQQQPSPQAIQPSYESWDVLRQYPRYVPLPPPSVIEQKAPEPQKETKEKTDV
jgi:hypothetical protein